MLLGARQFFERRGAPPPPLPYDAEVEYLGVGATIGPYIDTGYRWTTDNIKIDIEFMATGYAQFSTGLFGSQKIGVDTNWGIQFYHPGAYNLTAHYIGSTANVYTWQPTTNQKTYFAASTKSDHTWSIEIGGDVHTGAWSGTVCDNVTTVGLFTLYNNSNMTARRTNYVNVYSFKLTDDGVLVRDMIPVRFTNELGQSEGAMYDRVSGALFRNAGTGSFVIGPDKS